MHKRKLIFVIILFVAAVASLCHWLWSWGKTSHQAIKMPSREQTQAAIRKMASPEFKSLPDSEKRKIMMEIGPPRPGVQIPENFTAEQKEALQSNMKAMMETFRRQSPETKNMKKDGQKNNSGKETGKTSEQAEKGKDERRGGPPHDGNVRNMQKDIFGRGSSSMRAQIEADMKVNGPPGPPPEERKQ